MVKFLNTQQSTISGGSVEGKSQFGTSLIQWTGIFPEGQPAKSEGNLKFKTRMNKISN